MMSRMLRSRAAEEAFGVKRHFGLAASLFLRPALCADPGSSKAKLGRRTKSRAMTDGAIVAPIGKSVMALTPFRGASA